MKMSSVRRALIAAVVLAGTSALVTGLVPAQTPPGPPVCGSVASLMNLQIFLDTDGSGPKGNNIVSLPAVNPTRTFQDVCRRFGIPAGSGSPNGTAVTQFNADTGGTVTVLCNQPVDQNLTDGQAVLVQPVAAGLADPNNITGRIPGVECARPYTSYGDAGGAIGDNLFPTPVTIATSSPEDLCGMLNLPSDPNGVNSASVIHFVAGPGSILTHRCGQTPTFGLRIGEGVLIRPPGTPGSPVATGTPVIF
jgi:hypothetical protein